MKRHVLLQSLLLLIMKMTSGFPIITTAPKYNNVVLLLSNKDRDNDWVEAELQLLDFPIEPSSDLSPEKVAKSCVRSLQLVDFPNENDGLIRCFPFFMWECRKVVTARQGGDTCERFVKYGLLSHPLQVFMGAKRIEFGEATFTPSLSATRGDLVSYPIVIYGSDVLSFQHSSGFIKNSIGAPPVTNMVMRLEKQRRPPLQNCWLVKELQDVNDFFAGDMGNAHVGG